MPGTSAPETRQNDRRILSEATVNTATQLGLTNAELGEVLGLSQSTVSRMRRGSYYLDPATKSWDAALLLVRLYRSLGAIVAGDPEVARQWLANPNADLGETPKTLIQQIQGLVHVVDYLDAHRAVV